MRVDERMIFDIPKFAEVRGRKGKGRQERGKRKPQPQRSLRAATTL